MKKIYLHFLVFPCTLLFVKVNGQQPLPDSVFYKEATENFINSYTNQTGPNLQLYNGSEYLRNGQKAKGFPFFDSDSLLSGVISYNDISYQNIRMHYDLVSDEVVVNTYNHNDIIPASGKINFFLLNHHYFLRIVPEKSFSSLLKTGFYEQLYNSADTSFVFAKHEKRLKYPSSAEEDIRYISYNYYFLKKRNTYYKIESKDGLLDILKDKKNELKKFIKSNKLNFKEQFEEAIIRTIDYYDQIKP